MDRYQRARVILVSQERKYFKILIAGRYESHLAIDENTKTLPYHEPIDMVMREDSESNSTRFIFVGQVPADDVGVELGEMEYNPALVEECHMLAGRWDAGKKTWTFPSLLKEQVDALYKKYTENPVLVRATFTRPHQYEGWVRVGGVPIVRYNNKELEWREGAKIVTGSVDQKWISKSKGYRLTVEPGTVLEFYLPREVFEALAGNRPIKLTKAPNSTKHPPSWFC